MILHILLLFIPFLFLFVLGFEIYLKNPRNRMNRQCMLIMMSLSLFFLGGFWANTIPLEAAFYVTVYVKYLSIFVTMSLGLYMFCSLSKIAIKKLHHMLCLMPLLGILPIVISTPKDLVSISQSQHWRHEQLASELLAVIFVFTVYSFLLMLLFISNGTRQQASRRWQEKELLRMEWIKKGLLYSLIWALLWSVISVLKNFFSPDSLLRELPYNTIPAYCIIIWAFFIRYAVTRFDFLASPAGGTKCCLPSLNRESH